MRSGESAVVAHAPNAVARTNGTRSMGFTNSPERKEAGGRRWFCEWTGPFVQRSCRRPAAPARGNAQPCRRDLASPWRIRVGERAELWLRPCRALELNRRGAIDGGARDAAGGAVDGRAIERGERHVGRRALAARPLHRGERIQEQRTRKKAMKTQSIAALFLPLVLGATACASDPSKGVREAKAERADEI